MPSRPFDASIVHLSAWGAFVAALLARGRFCSFPFCTITALHPTLCRALLELPRLQFEVTRHAARLVIAAHPLHLI